MTKSALAIGAAAILFLAGCEGLVPPSAQLGTGGGTQVASVAPSPVIGGPLDIYRIEKVTPTIAPGAPVGWFRLGEGSPREVGGYVGSAVIEGIKGQFNGATPLEMEVQIKQFEPVVGVQPYGVEAIHRVTVDLVLKDPVSGDMIGRSPDLYMDLVALTGTAAVIAENAGRTPEIRVQERIQQIAAAWAKELSCIEIICPQSVAVAAAEPVAPVAKPERVSPTPAVEAPAPVVAAPPPAPVVAAAPPAPEPAPAAMVVAAPPPAAPAPVASRDPFTTAEAAPVAEPEAVAEAAEEDINPLAAFFTRLTEAGVSPADEPEAPAVVAAAEAPETPAAPEAIVAEQTVESAPAAPAAPVAVAEEATAPEPNSIETFFAGLFAVDDEADDTEAAPAAEEVVTAEVAPAPAPAPVAVAPQPEPQAAPVQDTPRVSQDPAPAIAAAPVPEPAPAPAEQSVIAQRVPPTPTTTPDESAVVAQSPFFRSPAGTVPTLPQQALLGRSQRANDPLRRRVGDVVLEISNLPAFWDGDATSGGIWVALPYVPAYRRAIVTNPVNGRTVEANLFWRDPQAGGGSTLLSSAAAEALGVAPGQVSNLGVKVVAAD